MTPEQKQRRSARAAAWYAGLSTEQKNELRLKNIERRRNLTPEQKAARLKKERERKASRTAEQRIEDSRRKRDWWAERGAGLEKNRARTPELRERAQANRREWRCRYTYGLEPSELESLLGSQGGACAICNIPGGKLVIDHCHATEKLIGRRLSVRGLVHLKCNTAIGQAGDRPEVLRKGADYLEREQARLEALVEEVLGKKAA